LHARAKSITFFPMANSLTKLLVHITFSTRNRTSSIPEELEPRLYAFIGGICRKKKSPLLTMNGTADHVHMLISLDKNMTLPNLLLHVKRDSSTWMNDRTKKRFNWQDGYFGFSIGESGVDALTKYITRQKQHHKKLTFKEEVEALLAKYKVEYDPKEIWD
jgi:putative transposase